MAELVDAVVLEATPFGGAGSSPAERTRVLGYVVNRWFVKPEKRMQVPYTRPYPLV